MSEQTCGMGPGPDCICGRCGNDKAGELLAEPTECDGYNCCPLQPEVNRLQAQVADKTETEQDLLCAEEKVAQLTEELGLLKIAHDHKETLLDSCEKALAERDIKVAGLEAGKQWMSVADKEPPKGVEVWIKGPLFELRATLDVVDYNEMAQKNCWGWVLSNRSLMLDDDLEIDGWRHINPPTASKETKVFRGTDSERNMLQPRSVDYHCKQGGATYTQPTASEGVVPVSGRIVGGEPIYDEIGVTEPEGE